MKLVKDTTLTARQLRAFVAVAFFMVLLVLHNTVVSLHLASLRASQRYERATNDRIKKEKAITNKLKAKHVDLEKLLEERVVRERTLFTEPEAEEFFKKLEATCTAAGCDVASVDYGLPKPEDTIEVPDSDCVIVGRTAGLEVSGKYSDIVNLMRKLDSASHKVWLDTFRLSTDRLEAGVIRCRITLTILVSQTKENSGDEKPIHQ